MQIASCKVASPLRSYTEPCLKVSLSLTSPHFYRELLMFTYECNTYALWMRNLPVAKWIWVLLEFFHHPSPFQINDSALVHVICPPSCLPLTDNYYLVNCHSTSHETCFVCAFIVFDKIKNERIAEIDVFNLLHEPLILPVAFVFVVILVFIYFLMTQNQGTCTGCTM